MKCSVCQKENENYYNYCIACGAKLKKDEEINTNQPNNTYQNKVGYNYNIPYNNLNNNSVWQPNQNVFPNVVKKTNAHIIGIVAISICILIPFISQIAGIILGLISLIMGIQKHNIHKTRSNIAIVLGILSIILSIIFFAIWYDFLMEVTYYPIRDPGLMQI